MPIRLIDETATKPVDIDGTVFHIKQLSGADKGTLSIYMHPTEDGGFAGDMVAMLPTLSRGVDYIEGYENYKVLKVLQRIESPLHIARLFSAVMTFSRLTDDERKNSSSSPESSSPEKKSATAGSPATNTKSTSKDSASPGTSKSPASNPEGEA